jgi:hypothetical protein
MVIIDPGQLRSQKLSWPVSIGLGFDVMDVWTKPLTRRTLRVGSSGAIG